MTLDPESIDLLSLTRRLAADLGAEAIPGGYLEGKTGARNLLLNYFGCSELEAEQVVDTLVARGFMRFHTAAESQGGWQLEVQALNAGDRINHASNLGFFDAAVHAGYVKPVRRHRFACHF